MWPAQAGRRVMMDAILCTSQLMQGVQWPGTDNACSYQKEQPVLKAAGCGRYSMQESIPP